jgi:AbrB family looped-hinge helix DNA binding protein
MDKKEWLRKVDAQFRVTIPAELRQKYKLKAGTRVVLEARENFIYFTAKRNPRRKRRKKP